MATTFMDPGSDATQGLEFYQTVVAAVTSDSGTFHTGGRSIRCNTGSPVTIPSFRVDNVLADAGRRISYFMRFDGLPTAGNATICQIQDSSGLLVARLQITTSGTTSFLGGTTVNGSTVLAANTWYQLCICYTVTNTTTFSFKFYINGVLETTMNAGSLARVGTNKFLLSGLSSNVNTSIYYDDIYIDDGNGTNYPGAIVVTAKRPISNGTTNGFTATGTPSGTGTGNARYVNERPLNQTNFVSVVAAGVAITEEYNIEDIASGDVNISGHRIVDVCAWLYGKSLSSETAQIILNNVASNIALTSTAAMFQAFAGATAYPAGSGKDIGIISAPTATTVTMYECGIMVAYIPQVIPRIIFPRRVA